MNSRSPVFPPMPAMQFSSLWLIVSMTALAMVSLSGCASLAPPLSETPSAPVASAPDKPTPAGTASASPSPLSDTPVADAWAQAMNRAMGAATLAGSAQSQDDWQLVHRRWQEAIALLKTIPSTDARYAQVQSKIAEYERNAAVAQRRGEQPPPSPSNTPSMPIATSQPSSDPVVSPEPIASASGESPEVALATHLANTGATMYGTYWCGYCNRQRTLFGDGVSRLPQVECDPQGENARPDLCRQAQVFAFPTWEINGQLYPGLLSLNELADLSGYQGSREFQD